MSSPASSSTQDSARPGDGRGDLEPQITTFNVSSLSRKGSALKRIFCIPTVSYTHLTLPTILLV